MSQNIFFTDEGKGYPILFIHGFCETQEMWDNFKKSFLDSYRVITIDLPGFGKSQLAQDDFSIADIAESVIGFLESKDIDNLFIVGHSLGGYVMLEMAKLNPDLISGFCMFHSNALADDEEKKDSRNKTIAFVEKRGVKVFAESFVPSLFFQKNRKQLTEVVNKAVEIAAETPLETLVAYTKAMRDRSDRTDVLSNFEYPILIIAGDKDTSVPLEKIEPQFLLPKRVIVKVLKNTGHMGMFEREEETVEEILNFCRLNIE